MLFFLAGNEIDFAAIRGRPITRAAIGWIISLVAAFGIAITFAAHAAAAAFIAIALTSTALGTIMPVLRDSGDLRTPFGVGVIALGAVGEFGPLLAISIFLGGRSPLVATIVLLLFALVAAAAIWMAARGAGRRLHRIITATLHTSGQFGVRLVVLVLVALVALSIVLDLDMLLGAFTAGILYRLLLSGAPEHDVEIMEGKIEALGYGFLVPIFFIYTGVTYDLEALFADPWTLSLLGLRRRDAARDPRPAVAARRSAGFEPRAISSRRRSSVPPGCRSSSRSRRSASTRATSRRGTAAALVGAGMLSVLLFPLIALAVRRRSSDAASLEPDDDVHVPTEG